MAIVNSYDLVNKGSEVISHFANVDTILFDKTGTLTEGKPEVGEFVYYGNNQEEDLSLLFSVERESDHPLAVAITNKLAQYKLRPVERTQVIKGGGIIAHVDGHIVAVGNKNLMEQERIPLSADVLKKLDTLERDGSSIVLTAVDHQLMILMGIRDQVRPGVKQDLQKLKSLGVKNLIVLSGDNQGTVNLVKKELGLTEAHGDMLPEDKQAFLKERQSTGEIVAFIGDGGNDSPSLAIAEVGIAMGNGTDVAIESSDIVLMNSNFNRLPHALGLAKGTYANMRQNILIAVGVVIILLFSLLFSEWMSMSIGMLVHEARILVVILNGMRLRGYKLK